MSQINSVIAVTRPRAGHLKNRDSIPGKGKRSNSNAVHLPMPCFNTTKYNAFECGHKQYKVLCSTAIYLVIL